jgi:DNA-binding protein HU-beta
MLALQTGILLAVILVILVYQHPDKQMNKADLTEALASRASIPKVRAANYINIVMTTIQDALVSNDKVTISDFGTFTVSQRREFVGHNPKNGSEIRVPARKIPVFRAGKGLKESLNP